MTPKLHPFCLVFALLLASLTAFAQQEPATTQAIQFFKSQTKALGLSPSDVAEFRISDAYQTRHNGVTHVFLNQQYAKLDVLGAVANINVRPDGRILTFGARFIPNLAQKVTHTTPEVTPESAVKTAIQTFGMDKGKPLGAAQKVSDFLYVFPNDGITLTPVKAKLCLLPLDNQSVKLVWRINLYEPDGQNEWIAGVDAITGDLVSFYDQVLHCDFTPAESHCEDTRAHTHFPKPTDNPLLAPPPPPNSEAYFVLPMPLQSPYWGDAEWVTSPADPVASPFGWHDTDGTDGAEYTITRGNNVHAYQDILAQNSSIGDEPDGGDSLHFGFPYDPANEFPYTQIEAATTNLFYWNNIVHDVFYHYGFDEVSGNFQENNYGKGGLENDAVAAETLDGSFVNNANFNTQVDGELSRMQM
ncbi:MAG: metalloprotease, partial [Bacteroidetes bacterium]